MTTKIISILSICIIFISSCTPKITGDDVVASFKANGLEAENTTPMTPQDYGAAPFLCTGTRFLIPSLGEDSGGRIFICDNKEDRNKLAIYYIELGASSALFFSWVYVKDNIVVQINGELPEATAKQYEAAIP